MRKSLLLLAVLAMIGVRVLSADTLITGNLLTNPGAETGDLTGWIIGGPGTPIVDNGTGELPYVLLPNSGNYDFVGSTGPGGTSPPPVFADSLSQTVSILAPGVTPELVDAGLVFADLSFWEQSLPQDVNDSAGVQLTFLDDTSTPIGTVASPYIGSSGSWENFSAVYAIPVGTTAITYTMDFWRNTGFYQDGFIDDNSLQEIVVTPEPATLLFTLSGLGFVALFRRLTKRA